MDAFPPAAHHTHTRAVRCRGHHEHKAVSEAAAEQRLQPRHVEDDDVIVGERAEMDRMRQRKTKPPLAAVADKRFGHGARPKPEQR